MAKRKGKRWETKPVIVDTAVAELRQRYSGVVEGVSAVGVATIRQKVDEFRTLELLFFRKSNLREILRKTNVYRYAATTTSPAQFIRWALFANYAGSAASRFGHLLEDSAIDIANESPNRRAKKISTSGFDAEVCLLDGNRRIICECLVCMKSGRHVFNKDSTTGQGASVETAMRVLRQTPSAHDQRAVWWVAYGGCKKGTSSPKLHFDLCVTGQAAWAFLSGNPALYITLCRIVEEGAQEFAQLLEVEQRAAIDRLIDAIRRGEYIAPDGTICWVKILQQICGNYGTMMKNPLFRAMMELDFARHNEENPQ